MDIINFDKYFNLIDKSYIKHFGKVSKVVGLTVESLGPSVHLGSLCKITSNSTLEEVLAEVVGFRDNKILLMPLGKLDGVGLGSMVEAIGEPLKVPVGYELLGKIINGLGQPMSDGDKFYPNNFYPLEAEPPDPLKRNRIQKPLSLGIRAIDGLLTVGKGQRIGIFAGSGVGKSTLLGMMARNTSANINVIALIGERGREVREFIEKDLGEEGLKRSVVIVATSDQPALIRQKAAKTAIAIAEYFRDQGEDVLFMMDSLTRFSMAQREIGLAIGEPPVSRGYTPSVFAEMPKILERAGNSEKGSITGLYTVLVDGDDFNEPITDTARGILDGHVMLSRNLANKNHFPAIDVLHSVSRVMNDIISEEHKKNVGQLKSTLAVYREAEDLISIGAYKKGSNKEIDQAIKKIDKINSFLKQETEENVPFEETLALINQLFDE